MKLAIVTTHPIQYNAPWFRLLAAEEGVDVKVFYTWESSQNLAKYDPGFNRVVEWDIPLLDGYEYVFVKNISTDQGSHHYKGIDNPDLNKVIEDWGAEAVLVFGWPYKSHLSCLRYFKKKIPVLFRGDSTMLDEQPGIKKILRRLFLRYVYSFVDYCLYVGTNNKAYYKAHGLKERQLIYVPHAIDNDRFALSSEERKTEATLWRKELGVPEYAFVALFAGKLEHKKDPGFMLRLAAELKGEQFRFIIVGNGPLESELKAGCKDHRVIFLDFQNQEKMPLVYRLGDVFILPSVGPGETWGLAINEAMASGAYVVATDKVGGALDMIQEGKNGIMIHCGDTRKTSEYIRHVMKGTEIDSHEKDMVNRDLLGVHSFESLVKKTAEFLKNLDKQVTKHSVSSK